jgi:hypothetical protein
MADPAQHPPEPCGIHAALRVIGHDQRIAIDAQHAQARHEQFGIRQRVATAEASLRSGEFVVEVEVERAGDMAC